MTAALRYEDETAVEDVRNALGLLVATDGALGLDDILAIKRRLESAVTKLERKGAPCAR